VAIARKGKPAHRIYCAGPLFNRPEQEEMAEIVRDTVVHELGHYFGLDDETMEQIEDSDP